MSSSSVLVVNEKDLSRRYPEIGRGDEGIVYNYDNKYAIKIFTRYLRSENKMKLKRKIGKVKELAQLQDSGCSFPLGLVSTDGETLTGYYSKLIRQKGDMSDFSDLDSLKDFRKKLILLQKGDQTLRRIHNLGITLGDIKGNNILIDENENPIYVDLDNCMYGSHFFEMVPDRAGLLYSCFGGPVAHKDNDKLLYAILAMRALTGDNRFSHFSDGATMREAIRKLKVDEETREQLLTIFSKETDKPYIGDVLPKVR